MEPSLRIINIRGEILTKDLPLLPIVKPTIERLIGRPLEKGHILIFRLVSGEAPKGISAFWPPLLELPKLKFRGKEETYLHLRVRKKEEVIYDRWHTLDQIIASPLQKQLVRLFPKEKMIWYDFENARDRQQELVIPTPKVEGLMELRPYAKEHSPFRIKAIKQELPRRSMLDFVKHVDKHKQEALVKILMTRSLHQDLLEQRQFSSEVEEGGFLIGKAFSDGERDNSYILKVTEAIEAKHTGASIFHLTYTGESFTVIKNFLRKHRPEERLLGWYHTHLFPAKEIMGLSSIDLNLHFNTFRIPWQTAGLINIDHNGNRVIRFYVRIPQTNKMKLCPMWVIEDSDSFSSH